MSLYRLFLIWLCRDIGVHACVEFTPWQESESRVRRLSSNWEWMTIPGAMNHITIVTETQSRRCKECNRVETIVLSTHKE